MLRLPSHECYLPSVGGPPGGGLAVRGHELLRHGAIGTAHPQIPILWVHPGDPLSVMGIIHIPRGNARKDVPELFGAWIKFFNPAMRSQAIDCEQAIACRHKRNSLEPFEIGRASC